MASHLRHNLKFFKLIANEDLKMVKAIIGSGSKELLIHVRRTNILVQEKQKRQKLAGKLTEEREAGSS